MFTVVPIEGVKNTFQHAYIQYMCMARVQVSVSRLTSQLGWSWHQGRGVSIVVLPLDRLSQSWKLLQTVV